MTVECCVAIGRSLKSNRLRRSMWTVPGWNVNFHTIFHPSISVAILLQDVVNDARAICAISRVSRP